MKQNKRMRQNLPNGPKASLSIKMCSADYEKNYAAWTPYAKERVYVIEGILGSPLTAFAPHCLRWKEL